MYGFHSMYLPGLTRRKRIATIDWRKDASIDVLGDTSILSSRVNMEHTHFNTYI